MKALTIVIVILMVFNNIKEVNSLQENMTVQVKVFYRYNCIKDRKFVQELRGLLDNSGLSQNKNVSYVERDIFGSGLPELNSIMEKLNITYLNPLVNLPIIVITKEETTMLLDENHSRLIVPIVNSLLKGEMQQLEPLPTPVTPGITIPSSQNALLITSLLSGFYSGINPCTIALFTFLLAVSLRQSMKRAIYKLIAVSIGVLLSYTLFGIIFLLFQVPLALVTPIKVVATFMLVAFGFIHLGGYFQSELFLWKTPRKLYNYVVKIADMNKLLTDFYLGILFGLIKIPCIGPFYIYWIFRLSTEPALAPLILITFNLGMVSLPLILSIFTMAGLIRFEKLRKFRNESRQPYKLITGGLLLGLATFIWLF